MGVTFGSCTYISSAGGLLSLLCYLSFADRFPLKRGTGTRHFSLRYQMFLEKATSFISSVQCHFVWNQFDFEKGLSVIERKYAPRSLVIVKSTITGVTSMICTGHHRCSGMSAKRFGRWFKLRWIHVHRYCFRLLQQPFMFVCDEHSIRIAIASVVFY